MTALLGELAPVLAGAGIFLAALVLLTTRSVVVAVPVLLDLLLAAGLLRLSATATWAAIGSTAVIIVIRKLATLGISRGQSARVLPSSVRSR